MDQLTSEQLSEWEAYDRLDPIGGWREDFRWAHALSTITNLAISIHSKKGTKYTTISDFMLEWDIEKQTMEPPQQSIEDMKAVLFAIAKTQGVRKKKTVTVPNKETGG